MASVMGLLEEREATARVRVEGFRQRRTGFRLNSAWPRRCWNAG